MNFLASFTLLPWDKEAADRFTRLRKQGIRIGSMDLKSPASQSSTTLPC